MRTRALLNPPKFKPARDRHVDVLAVACPTCKSKPRVKCVKADGTTPTSHMQHPTRRRMAVRADNLARGI